PNRMRPRPPAQAILSKRKGGPLPRIVPQNGPANRGLAERMNHDVDGSVRLRPGPAVVNPAAAPAPRDPALAASRVATELFDAIEMKDFDGYASAVKALIEMNADDSFSDPFEIAFLGRSEESRSMIGRWVGEMHESLTMSDDVDDRHVETSKVIV